MIYSRGAEAILIKEKDRLIKNRIKKNYRIQQLDHRLRKKRTQLETRLLREAIRNNVPVPRIFKSKRYQIEMEFIKGPQLKSVLDEKPILTKNIGKSIAKLHQRNIIHGDLTTSNMILSNGQVYFIDFGLGYRSTKHEDKAVDLYVLYQALNAAHKHPEKLWESLLKTYLKKSKESLQVLKRLKKIRKRGRYKKR